MKRLTATLALLLITCTSLPAQTGGPAARPAHPVETFFMEGIRAFNAHDLDEFMKQFADDLEMYAADRGWLRGKSLVRQRFVETSRQYPSVRMEIEDLRVREVAPGVALVDFKYRTYPSGTGPAFHGVGSGVYLLRRGRWVEVLEHESIVRIDEGIKRSGK